MDSPQYPLWPSQPNSGDLPGSGEWPYDLYPSATNDRAYDMYRGTRQRRIAGLGDVKSSTKNADGDDVQYATIRDIGAIQGMLDYPEELDKLADIEDVSGNGVFDPPGAAQQVHADAGIFGDRWNFPGYLARERMFAPSEVLDITTGNPVVYIPGNSFMLDPRTPDALRELELYEPGWPSTGGRGVTSRSTVEPDGAAWPLAIGAADGGEDADEREPASGVELFAAAAVAGLAAGMFLALVAPKRRRT